MIHDYFLTGYKTVSGWVAPGAMTMLYHISRFQMENGVSGDVAEIGVHHGKFLIALALLLNRGEKAIGLDVFDLQEFNLDKSGKGSKDITQQHCQRFVDAGVKIDLVTADSLKLSIGSLRQLLPHDVRIFSIDGGHTEFHTANDLLLAQEATKAGGLIIVDDFYNADWPGVAEGVHRFFLMGTCRKIAPVAYGDNKLYLSTHSHRDSYLTYFRKLSSQALHSKPVVLWGYPVVHIRMPEPMALVT